MNIFQKRIENLCDEIIGRILALMQANSVSEVILKDNDNPVYVIWFDKTGDPCECSVHKVTAVGEGITLEVHDKITGENYKVTSRHEAALANPVWLNDILEAMTNIFQIKNSKYSINSLVYWVTYVHNVVYSFYRSMIYCYINSTQRCAGSIVIDIIPTNGADKRKFFPFAPYFPVTNVIKRYFYPYFPAIIGIKGYSFPYFPYLSGIMKIKTALYSLFSRLDWHKTVVFPCLGEIYEGIRSLSWEIPVT